jgi:hypothetical protein
MAPLERCGPPRTDVRGDAVRAGLGAAQAGRLRRLGMFAAEHPALQPAWLAGRVGGDHVAAVRDVAVRLATPELRAELVGLPLPLPHLPGLRLRGRRSPGKRCGGADRTVLRGDHPGAGASP